MKHMLSAWLLAGSIVLPALSHAEESQYRTPDTFTAEEIQGMVSSMSGYGVCLRDEAMKILNQYADVRQIGEIAMTQCQNVLDELDGDMAAKNFSPEFRKSYITNGRNRAARVMLPEIMRLKATGY